MKFNKELITKHFFFCQFFFSFIIPFEKASIVIDFYPHCLYSDIPNLAQFFEFLEEVKKEKEVKENEIIKP